MDKIKFVKSRFETSWGWQLNDGRIIEVMSEDKECFINFATPFNIETGEIYRGNDLKRTGKNGLPNDAPEGFTTLNNLKVQGNGNEVHCYEEYDINLGVKPKMGDKQINKIIAEFENAGFKVTKDAILHNYYAWAADFKSGYRDEENEYHLFSPCGCNPLSLRATTLHKLCSDWQITYEC